MHPLDPILDSWIDGRTKGWPQDRPPARIREIPSLGLDLLAGDLDWPVAVLRAEVLESNARWMRDFLAHTGASLCPHGKTTMAPQLFHRQLADGAWGLTLATPRQVRVAYDFGIRRILMANQLLSGPAIRWIQEARTADPDFDFTCLVDSKEGLEALAGGPPLSVLLELGWPGGRTGVRDSAEALALARMIRRAPHLHLRGVACYEGILASGDPEKDAAAVDQWLEALAALACECDAQGLFQTDEILLSAGGSAYFDRVARILGELRLLRPSRVLLRSGCYLSHDGAHYRRLVDHLETRLPWTCEGHLEAALQIWGQVLSRPEPGMALLDFGKRDASHDLGLPLPIRWFRKGVQVNPQPAPEGWRITRFHDQHAQLDLPPGTDVHPGDVVACTISHPCTTFDKWPVIYVADDSWRIVDAVRTFF